MTYDNPIITYIIADILECLAEMTTANGYRYDYETPEENEPDGNNCQHLKPLVYLDGDEPGEATNLTETHNTTIGVFVPYFAPESGVSPNTARAYIWDDVRKALVIDKTRGGKAEDTTFGPADFFDQGIIISVVVQYQNTINDLCSQPA